MQKGPLLAGRYRILRRLTDGSTNAVWLAEDEQTGFFVLASVMPLSRAQGLRNAVGLPHPHLAALVDLLDANAAGPLPDGVTLERGACVTIAEWVSGATLYDQLLDGRMSTVPAVRTVASLASAVSAMHARGAVHGAISTRSVVMERTDGGTVPVLTQGAVPADGSFCSLDRIKGGGPGEDDDSWALHVVLYNALTGRRPYRARSHDALVRALHNARPIPLAALDVDDVVLGDLVDVALVPARRDSIRRVSDLETILYRWIGEHCQPPSLRTPLPDDDASAPHLEIGTFVDASSPGLRVETPTVMPPPATMDAVEALSGSHSPAPLAPPGPEPQAEPEQRDTPVDAAEPPDAPASDASPPETPPSNAEATVPVNPRPGPVELGSAAPATGAPILDDADKSRGGWLLPVVAVVGAASIAGAVWLVSSLRHSSVSPSTGAPAGLASTAASSSANAPASRTATSASATTGPDARESPTASAAHVASQRTSTPAEVAACTARWFPAQTFHVAQDLSFVCSVRDPRDAAKRMRQRVVVGARGALTAGMREWSRLGWYQLAALATVRGDCCPNQIPFELPELKMCPRLDTALDSLAVALHDGANTKAAVAGFEKAAECAYRVQPQDYPYSVPPKGGSQFAFDELLARGGR